MIFIYVYCELLKKKLVCDIKKYCGAHHKGKKKAINCSILICVKSKRGLKQWDMVSIWRNGMIDIIKYFLNFFFNYLHERALVLTIAHTHKKGTQNHICLVA